MTLDTRVRIHDPLDPRDVFAHARLLIGADASKRSDWSGNALRMLPGQGLPGLLYVYHGPDGGPLRSDGEPDAPAGFVEASLDTAYGYRASNGATCGDLHAWFVTRLGEWLDERGVKWSWYDESADEWHEGADGLDDFGDTSIGAPA